MAQFGSALALGARCRRFESCLPDCNLSESPTRLRQPGAERHRVFYCPSRSKQATVTRASFSIKVRSLRFSVVMP